MNSESVCFESQIFEAFLEAKDKNPNLPFVATKDITECYNNGKDFSDRVKSRTVANIIRSLGFSDKRLNIAYGFKPDSTRIANLKKRFRIGDMQKIVQQKQNQAERQKEINFLKYKIQNLENSKIKDSFGSDWIKQCDKEIKECKDKIEVLKQQTLEESDSQ